MAKKKSKKKQPSPAGILERAETLFNKKSYQAALREYGKYVKLEKNSIPESIADHLKVCEQKTAAIRARELQKKAQRLLKKKKPTQALIFFKQAYAITGDKSLAVKIAELQVESGNSEIAASVQRAEAEGDYLGAAELLRQRLAIHPDNSLLCHQGLCLLMAGQWQQAGTIYAKADCSTPADLYNAGFALARQQKFVDCLIHWQKIPSEHPDFLAQKKTVYALLFRGITTRLAENPLELETEIQQLLKVLPSIKEQPEARDILARCRCLRLARLWQQGRNMEIMALSNETDPLNPVVLEIHAKAAYQLMEAKESRLPVSTVRDFVDYWLSAIFFALAGQISLGKDGTIENNCQVLIGLGAGLVRKYAEYHPETGEQLLEKWQENYDLLNLFNKLPLAENRKKIIPAYTPALALRAGIAEEFFLLVKDNEDAFADSERFLLAGAAYSPAAASLLMIQNQEYDEAFNSLEQLEKNNDDPFVAHGIGRIKFACGLHYFACGYFEKAEGLLLDIAEFLEQSRDLKIKLLAVLNRDEDWNSDRLTVCANILAIFQKNCPSSEIDKALCAVMTRRAVRLYNNNKMNSKILVGTLQKAANLDPANEFTSINLKDAKYNIEAFELQKAIDRYKLSRASSIAIKSKYPQIRDLFFNFISQVLQSTENDCSLVFMDIRMTLKDLLKSAVKVDPTHQIIDQLEDKIAALEERE